MHGQGARHTWPVVVVGGGAAGLTAGIFAGRAGAEVLVLEGRRQVGAKIRASGGGRCNVLPAAATPGDFATSGSPNALRNILMSWPLPAVTRFFVDELGLPLKCEPPGKLFPCSDEARDVVRALLEGLAGSGARLACDCRLAGLTPLPPGAGPPGPAPGAPPPRWRLTLADGRTLQAHSVVLACGGLSLPRTGCDGGGWRLLQGLGHGLVPPHPALVPLHHGDVGLQALAGLSVPATLSAAGETAAGELLLTHSGLSGPAALDISRVLTAPAPGAATAAPGGALTVALGAARPWAEVLAPAPRPLGAALREQVPRRLVALICERAAVDPQASLASLPRAARQRLVALLGGLPVAIHGHGGYARAEVTAGGIPLAEVETRTLHSRRGAGLYVAGEMLDVVGRLGGFNFLWAWVSGRRAGAAAAAAALAAAPQPALAAAG